MFVFQPTLFDFSFNVTTLKSIINRIKELYSHLNKPKCVSKVIDWLYDSGIEYIINNIKTENDEILKTLVELINILNNVVNEIKEYMDAPHFKCFKFDKYETQLNAKLQYLKVILLIDVYNSKSK